VKKNLIKRLFFAGSAKRNHRIQRDKACASFLISKENTQEGVFFTEERIAEHIHLMGEFNSTNFEFGVNMIRARFLRTVEFVEKNTNGAIFNPQETVLDVGDADGIFLDYFGKMGTSVNLDDKSCFYIRKNGFEAIQTDVSKLNLRRKFEYIFAFQLLEHVQDPINVLLNLRKHVSKLLFVTIPHLGQKTRIREFGFWDKEGLERQELSQKAHFHHIFEFSPEDFRKVISHAHFKVVDYEDCYNFFKPDPRFQMWALSPI
jgi:hypothetical protein